MSLYNGDVDGDGDGDGDIDALESDSVVKIFLKSLNSSDSENLISRFHFPYLY